jgi:HEPN domain-containing protein
MQTLTVAGVVCSAFAAELALKAILTVEGRRPTGPEHNLEKLFDAVSPTVRDRIYPLMSLSADEFMVKFRPCAKAFEGWRYIYESAEGYIDYIFARRCECFLCDCDDST